MFSCTSPPGAHLLLSPVTGRPSESTCWLAPAACALAAPAPPAAAPAALVAWAPPPADVAGPVAPVWAAVPPATPAPAVVAPLACSPEVPAAGPAALSPPPASV